MDSKKIISALSEMYDPAEFAFFEELRIGGGFGSNSEQRFDAWAIHYYPSKRNVTRIFEIKVSRGDFLGEIKKPLKRRHGLRLANEFYFATPKDLVKIEEVPPECGLLEVDDSGKITTKIPAPYRESLPTWNFLAALCRRMDKHRFLAEGEKKIARKMAKEYSILSRIVLSRHIEKWANFSQGNKEVPDQIAEALKAALAEVDDIIESGKYID